MLPRLPAALLASAVAAIVPGGARAAECAPDSGLSTCIDSDNLWPHAGGGASFAIGSASTTPDDLMSVGLVVSYLSRPIGLRVASPDPEGTEIHAVDNAVDATLLWGIGVTDWLELTLAAPVTLYQDGAGIADVIGSDAVLERSAIRDARLGASFAVVPEPRTGPPTGFGLVARLECALPVGDEEAFAGGATAVGIPSLAARYRYGRLGLLGELGGRIRGPVDLANARVASQISVALGATFDVLEGERLTLGAEAFALPTLAEQGPLVREQGERDAGDPLVPAEWIASVATAPALAGDLRLMLGGGGSLPLASESAVTSPRFRFGLSVRYAPTGRDLDADGVLDRDDRCLTVAEDKDGFEDADGCPEPDNDGDRIPDARDRCRDEAETVDGFQDEDGCPDLDDDGDGVPDVDDLDQVPDASDACPGSAEDKDGFEDDDGCPDPDDDEDGVADAGDACRREAETIDGRDDADGCPEPGARSRVGWSADAAVVLEPPVRFDAGAATLSKPLEAQARMLAQLVRGRSPLASVIVEAYPDRPGDESARGQALAGRRAEALKEVFVQAGLPAEAITAAAGDPSAKRTSASPPFDVTVTRAARKRAAKPAPAAPSAPPERP